MATNVFVTLTPPTGNGSGAAVDVSTMGATKTIAIGSSGTAYEPIVTIEASNDGISYAAVAAFQGKEEKTIAVACRYMRQTVQNYKSGTIPSVGVGGDNSGAVITSLAVTVGNGTGASSVTSTLAEWKSVQVGGTFKGTVNVEISNDAGVSYATVASFQTPGIQSAVFACDHMRVTRAGVPVIDPGIPSVVVASSPPPGGSGGGGTVVTDGTSVGGDGSIGSPIHTITGGVAVVTDGTTTTGDGTTGNPIVSSGGGPPDPTATVYYFDDFANAGSLVPESGGPGDHTGSVYKTGSSVVEVTTAIQPSTGGNKAAFGALFLQGVVAGGLAQYALNAASFMGTSDLTAPITVEWRILTETALASWDVLVGISRLVGGGAWDVDNMIGFSTGDLNWLANGVDTGIPIVTKQWYRLTVVLEGLTANFYVDDVLVSTESVSSANRLTFGVQAIAGAGDNANIQADWVKITWPVDRS